jgi:hypothetical protein
MPARTKSNISFRDSSMASLTQHCYSTVTLLFSACYRLRMQRCTAVVDSIAEEISNLLQLHVRVTYLAVIYLTVIEVM